MNKRKNGMFQRRKWGKCFENNMVRIKEVLRICRTLLSSDKPLNKLYEFEFHISFHCLSYIRAAGGGFMQFAGLSLFHQTHTAYRFFCVITSRIYSLKNSEI